MERVGRVWRTRVERTSAKGEKGKTANQTGGRRREIEEETGAELETYDIRERRKEIVLAANSLNGSLSLKNFKKNYLKKENIRTSNAGRVFSLTARRFMLEIMNRRD